MLRRCVPLLLLLLACPLIAAEPRGSDDWPQWRGPNRDNHSSFQNLLPNWEKRKPTLVWKSQGMGKGYASVSIADGVLYTTGNFDGAQGVVAVEIGNGNVLWKKRLTDRVPKHGYEGSRCTPSIDGDMLYVVTSEGDIVGLKRQNGDVVWRKNFRRDWNGKMMSGWGYSESPLVDGDRVICTPGANDAMLVALDKLTGAELWRTEMPRGSEGGNEGAGYSSVVISEGGGVKQYVQLIGRGVIGVRADNGKFLWGYNRIANGTANIPTPLTTGDYVFAATGYGAGTALLKLSKSGNGVKAQEVWFHPGNELQNHHGGMVMVGDSVYFGNGHGKGFPVCVAWKTGKIQWGGKLRGAGEGSAAVTYADGNLIFRYESGEVALIEATPKQYRLKGAFKPEVTNSPCWSHPVVVGGRLYLRDQDTLMCYDVAAK